MQEAGKEVVVKESPDEERAQKALARSSFYGILSRGFAYPTEEVLGEIKAGATSNELKGSAACLGEGLLQSVEALCEAMEREIAPLGLREVEGGYNRIFSMGLLCPHHETFYTSAHVFMKSQDLADIQGFYNAFGFRLAEEQKELADFIGTELEFMYVLCFKEYHAIKKGEKDKADLCREAQAKFVEGHIGTWTEAFSMTLTVSSHMDYFITLGRLLEKFVDFDCQYLGVAPKKVSAPEEGWKRETEPLSCGEDIQGLK
ncbi:MAG TPA: TorD/DmsD family molecular chaperone [Candidatus Tripitaka californicus]|uniref:TorD/DmsD family molecular chaperone n=1 Tax=Candidatus Tripitaka californicus TaxID=3367616 RepID=UPI004024EE8C|nr:molecular chaperone TorD family protein [Planctomycetota bacterium]